MTCELIIGPFLLKSQCRLKQDNPGGILYIKLRANLANAIKLSFKIESTKRARYESNNPCSFFVKINMKKA